MLGGCSSYSMNQNDCILNKDLQLLKQATNRTRASVLSVWAAVFEYSALLYVFTKYSMYYVLVLLYSVFAVLH